MLEAADSLVEGRQEDLGKFLADPGTLFVRLTRSSGQAIGDAAIGWNNARKMGFVFSDHLPPLNGNETYQIWGMDRPNHRVRIASFKAKPGSSVFQFQTEQPISPIIRVEIIPGGSATEDSMPILSGSIG